jgi:hypothetical protein
LSSKTRRGCISGGDLFLLIGGTLPAVLDVKEEPSRTPEEFHFARVQFNSYGGGWNWGWAQDYPHAETSLLKILSDLTVIKTTPQSYSIVRLDDPGIMQYPLLYFSEPGGWMITDQETSNFREYLDRGALPFLMTSMDPVTGLTSNAASARFFLKGTSSG